MNKDYTRDEHLLQIAMMIGGILISIVAITPFGDNSSETIHTIIVTVIVYWALTILMFIAIEGKATRRLLKGEKN